MIINNDQNANRVDNKLRTLTSLQQLNKWAFFPTSMLQVLISDWRRVSHDSHDCRENILSQIQDETALQTTQGWIYIIYFRYSLYFHYWFPFKSFIHLLLLQNWQCADEYDFRSWLHAFLQITAIVRKFPSVEASFDNLIRYQAGETSLPSFGRKLRSSFPFAIRETRSAIEPEWRYRPTVHTKRVAI